ncbi:alpha,alpha-trehalase [Saonia flava]|uniref:Alpha,alpha-trehalase n=1 Tax=Saonia flava TaxID=523696 RepID=A0A846QWB6_9FLAO|nr:trehalase family glycosidase [Saonia flava]NJB69875.1 alpha,alpha-trehalase [Saonia flava]
MKLTHIVLAFLLISCIACKTETQKIEVVDFYGTQLFKDIQMAAIYDDSKTFVDQLPLKSHTELVSLYEQEKNKPGFNLKAFVEANFRDNSMKALEFKTDTTKTMYAHITSMWEKLTRTPDSAFANSSRIVLPHEYVVPGGRFQEIYYWDSYFTMEGLLVDEKQELAKNMVDNFSHLINTIGFIPNGTRDYFLSRSQPPFYAVMVDALSRKDSTLLLEYLPTMVKEYEFWMSGLSDLSVDNPAERQVVQLDSTTVLNRYWDKKSTPRPEAYKEDVHLANKLETLEEKEALYNNLRSGAASGWDYSSRWYGGDDFGSTTTTTILPVDLNCLLYFMEKKIAEGYGLKGDDENQVKYQEKADTRKAILQTLFWDSNLGFFMDYDFKLQSTTDEETLAAAYPLFFNVATPKQAEAVKNRLISTFLKDGGLITTLKQTGQQWDAPNGWAPLQWIAVNGLLNYGYIEEAKEIMERWLSINEKVYKNTGKMMEKYNVEDTSLLSGGGEYKTQDGFGWTNGVALGFKKLLDDMDNIKE